MAWEEVSRKSTYGKLALFGKVGVSRVQLQERGETKGPLGGRVDFSKLVSSDYNFMVNICFGNECSIYE